MSPRHDAGAGKLRSIGSTHEPPRPESGYSEKKICSYPEYILRAFRYAIPIPIQFCEKGATEWIEGTSVNISHTGILFRSESNLVPGTLLEMRIILPFEAAGKVRVSVLCWGPVVRTEGLIGMTESAAAILRHYFIRD